MGPGQESEIEKLAVWESKDVSLLLEGQGLGGIVYCDLHPLSVQCWSGKEGNDKSYCVAHNLNRQASLPGISPFWPYTHYMQSLYGL